MKKVKRLRSTDWWLQNSHRNVKYNSGNIVNNAVISMYGARWVLDLRKNHLQKIFRDLKCKRE